MIPLLGPIAATRNRYAAPSWNEGRAIKPAASTASIVLTAAPHTSANRAWDPAGAVDVRNIQVVSYSEIRGSNEADGSYADELVIGGVTYEVTKAIRQPAFLGQPEHWVIDAVRVQTLLPEPGVEPPEEEP